MTTGAFLIARLGSSRLPRKNIMPIMGKPMIGRLIDRIRASSRIDRIVIATSDLPSDDPLESVAHDLGVDCYRGSLNNVMERIAGAAKAFESKTIVEILGDNPLLHSELIDDVIKFYQDGGYDYAATVTREYPVTDKKFFSIGLRVQVYSRSAAEQHVKYPEYMDGNDKHPCAYIFENPETFKVGYFEAIGRWEFMNRPDLTFAVNYQKNFDLVRAIFEKNHPEDRNFPLEMIYGQLNEEQDLLQLMGSE